VFSSFGEPVWMLGSCVGYTVESPVGRIGILEHVRRDPADGRVVELVVRGAGRNQQALVRLEADGVDSVLPSMRRLILQPETAVRASEPLRSRRAAIVAEIRAAERHAEPRLAE
jgi:hypothetical protein